MKLYIRAAQLPTPASQLVNRIGKYLYAHIDGAYKFKKDRNTYDLYMDLYYQALHDWTPNAWMDSPPVNEMKINISITTYQNKIRVNTIEITPEARTLGYDLFKLEQLEDLAEAQQLILSKVKRRIEAAYPNCIISI